MSLVNDQHIQRIINLLQKVQGGVTSLESRLATLDTEVSNLKNSSVSAQSYTGSCCSSSPSNYNPYVMQFRYDVICIGNTKLVIGYTTSSLNTKGTAKNPTLSVPVTGALMAATGSWGGSSSVQYVSLSRATSFSVSNYKAFIFLGYTT